MLTLLPDHFQLEEVTRFDLVLASMAWGFTLGIGWLTTWSAIKQTMGIWKRRRWDILQNSYFWMIWLEITVCLSFGVICFMYILGAIRPSFAFYFCILTLWALQVQFLLQIIINRCAILITDYRWAWRLKFGTALIITLINISVYCIWIPARLQINDTYIHINEWWDRCEKVIYLIVDAGLNFYFIRIVKQNLVQHGLVKYRGVVRFNMFIIGFSLAMDVLIIAMMSLENTFVYMQFHPLAYIVKLKIELSMADLIAKIAKNRDPNLAAGGRAADFYVGSNSNGTSQKTGTALTANRDADGKNRAWATVTTTVEMNTMDASGREVKRNGGGSGGPTGISHSDTDTLIDPVSPFSASAVAGNPAVTRRPAGTQKGNESISSFNSESDGQSGMKTNAL